MLVGFLGAGFGAYYSITTEQSDLKKDQVSIISDINELKEANKAYRSLPKDVEIMKSDIKDNAKLTKAIYIGLVAKGIIKPPQ